MSFSHCALVLCFILVGFVTLLGRLGGSLRFPSEKAPLHNAFARVRLDSFFLLGRRSNHIADVIPRNIHFIAVIGLNFPILLLCRLKRDDLHTIHRNPFHSLRQIDSPHHLIGLNFDEFKHTCFRFFLNHLLVQNKNFMALFCRVVLLVKAFLSFARPDKQRYIRSNQHHRKASNDNPIYHFVLLQTQVPHFARIHHFLHETAVCHAELMIDSCCSL